ncbi:DUF4058 family protein [Anabaena sp. FACHB-1237]|uniref:DUF4058 family protein n=1 Tax=Anabaena sp. FACHB-1237 TaxID=2692769 RepID=UPI0016800D50|nr:DUF4058 family protein [Anabaena sp. FACHB-1237]MBD2139122.1 DUF4058 family protein [Anabaena sp. FACHB-1237]
MNYPYFRSVLRSLHLPRSSDNRKKLSVPMYEEVIERFLEVKATQSREVVTVIEILSPKNKRSQEGKLMCSTHCIIKKPEVTVAQASCLY